MLGGQRAYQQFAETPLFAQEAALFQTFDRDAAIARTRAVLAMPDPSARQQQPDQPVAA